MRYFLRKRQKNHFGPQVSFTGKRASGDENEYNLFMGNEVLNIFHLTIFSKKKKFLEKMGEKIFGRYDHFLEGVILR